MVAPTCFGITLPSSGSVPSAFWEMLNWAAVDRMLWMGVLCLVTWCVAAMSSTLKTEAGLNFETLGTTNTGNSRLPRNAGSHLPGFMASHTGKPPYHHEDFPISLESTDAPQICPHFSRYYLWCVPYQTKTEVGPCCNSVTGVDRLRANSAEKRATSSRHEIKNTCCRSVQYVWDQQHCEIIFTAAQTHNGHCVVHVGRC
jgi:hypothetical protein